MARKSAQKSKKKSKKKSTKKKIKKSAEKKGNLRNALINLGVGTTGLVAGASGMYMYNKFQEGKKNDTWASPAPGPDPNAPGPSPPLPLALKDGGGDDAESVLSSTGPPPATVAGAFGVTPVEVTEKDIKSFRDEKGGFPGEPPPGGGAGGNEPNPWKDIWTDTKSREEAAEAAGNPSGKKSPAVGERIKPIVDFFNKVTGKSPSQYRRRYKRSPSSRKRRVVRRRSFKTTSRRKK